MSLKLETRLPALAGAKGRKRRRRKSHKQVDRVGKRDVNAANSRGRKKIDPNDKATNAQAENFNDKYSDPPAFRPYFW